MQQLSACITWFSLSFKTSHTDKNAKRSIITRTLIALPRMDMNRSVRSRCAWSQSGDINGWDTIDITLYGFHFNQYVGTINVYFIIPPTVRKQIYLCQPHTKRIIWLSKYHICGLGVRNVMERKSNFSGLPWLEPDGKDFQKIVLYGASSWMFLSDYVIYHCHVHPFLSPAPPLAAGFVSRIGVTISNFVGFKKRSL